METVTRQPPWRRPESFPWWMLLALLLGGLGLTGHGHYAQQQATWEAFALEQIRVIGDLKVREIAGWLQERQGNANTIFESRTGTALAAYLRQPNEAVRQAFLDWLDSLARHYGYREVALLDAAGAVILAPPGLAPGMDAPARDLVARAAAERRVVFSDLYGGDAPRLDWFIPLLADAAAPPAGVLLLRSDPPDYLFPLVGAWPTPSSSGETLLVRGQGDQVLFLSPLRYRPRERWLHLPLDSPDLPAALALRGEGGEVRGRDYRGRAVLAAIRAVPGSPWHLVAKQDLEEVRGPIRKDARETLFLVVALMLLACLVFWGLWRRRWEQWLRRSNDELERRVRERGAELEAEMLERRRAEQERDRFFNLSGDLLCVVGLDGYFKRLNPAWERLLGFSLEQLLGRPFTEILHPEDRERTRQSLQRLAGRGGVAQGFQNRYRDHSGAYHWLEWTGVPGNEPGELYCSARDVTGRKAAEQRQRQLLEQLDRQHQMLDTILGSTPDFFLLHDRDGRYQYANPPALRVLGMTLADLQGRTWRELGFPAAVMEPFDADLAAVFASGRPVARDIRFPVAGGMRDLETLLTPVREPDCGIRTVVATLRDVTERKRDQEQLQLWGRVVEATQNGVLVADATRADLPLVAVNPAFETITGYTAAEALGRNCRFLQNDDRDQPGLVELRQALRERRECRVVLRNYRKDGSLFWNELYLAPVRDAQGAVTHFIGVQSDITERKTYEEQLHYQANYDPLTHLPNRNLLADRLQHALVHAQRGGRLLAVLFMDLDRFKMINDSMGHAVGDSLLMAVAERLRQGVREEDTVARLGGDEFVLVLEGLSHRQAAEPLARKVLSVMDAPFTLDGQEFYINASVGVSLFPQDGRDAQTLLKNADTAMHRAKERGRNTVQFYAAGMNAEAGQRLVLENSLRRALDNGELELYYQPQADLVSGAVTGTETLLRWRHPDLGMVSPAEFIPLAEESGLIVPIGAWVLRTACAQAVAWRRAGLPVLSVAVNLSARQFLEAGLTDLVVRVLEETGLEPAGLELEITESLLMRDVDGAIATLDALKAMGVHLAIDDFGTGYSSLNYLKRFPIDRLKIDQAFVRDITVDPDDAAIAQAIIAMAHSLKLKVIAEGVETDAQLAFLRERGCDEMQGYYFSRPLPAAELEALLRAGRSLAMECGRGADRDRTLLLVDDEPAIVAALSRALRPDNYRIITATDAQQALQRLACQPAGVVVADQCMPGMNGVELFKRIRDLYPDTLRILLSGHRDPAGLIEAINEGAIYKFVGKPVPDTQLREVVREAFLVHQLRAGDRPPAAIGLPRAAVD